MVPPPKDHHQQQKQPEAEGRRRRSSTKKGTFLGFFGFFPFSNIFSPRKKNALPGNQEAPAPPKNLPAPPPSSHVGSCEAWEVATLQLLQGEGMQLDPEQYCLPPDPNNSHEIQTRGAQGLSCNRCVFSCFPVVSFHSHLFLGPDLHKTTVYVRHLLASSGDHHYYGSVAFVMEGNLAMCINVGDIARVYQKQPFEVEAIQTSRGTRIPTLKINTSVILPSFERWHSSIPERKHELQKYHCQATSVKCVIAKDASLSTRKTFVKVAQRMEKIYKQRWNK